MDTGTDQILSILISTVAYSTIIKVPLSIPETQNLSSLGSVSSQKRSIRARAHVCILQGNMSSYRAQFYYPSLWPVLADVLNRPRENRERGRLLAVLVSKKTNRGLWRENTHLSFAFGRYIAWLSNPIIHFLFLGGCSFAIMDDPSHSDAFPVHLQPTRHTTYYGDRCNSLHAGDINDRCFIQRVWKEALDDYDTFAEIAEMLMEAGFDENDPNLFEVMIILDELDDFVIDCEDIDALFM
eukprot:scaffold2035_cov53-Attheya_sp.AAC.2